MRKIATILLVLLLCGCCSIDAEIPGQPKLVTEIEVTYQSGPIRMHRRYDTSDKLRAVLTYFRTLKLYGNADTEEANLSGSEARVIVFYSDGSQKVFEQRNDQYLRTDDGPWQYIDPDQGQDLLLLLKLLESDSETIKNTK